MARTDAAPAALPQPESIRTLEEITREAATLPCRKAAFVERTFRPAEAARDAEADTYRAALVAAVRSDGPRPSRESLDRAEAALRRAEEELAAFDQVATDLEQERQRALGRQREAERAAMAEELARRRAAHEGLQAARVAAQRAWEDNDHQIQTLQIALNQ